MKPRLQRDIKCLYYIISALAEPNLTQELMAILQALLLPSSRGSRVCQCSTLIKIQLCQEQAAKLTQRFGAVPLQLVVQIQNFGAKRGG